ncbi:MAG: hypothetical protein GY743_10840, partial [Planctomycetaceae bacterium]|nr:hypothetical protein [Planctomycetaceae bacterium]
TTTEYDSFSRVSKVTRPEGLIVENLYNDYGYLKAIRSPRAQIGDYDADHISSTWAQRQPELEQQINTAQQRADELGAQAAVYRARAAEYRSMVHILQASPEDQQLDSNARATLQNLRQDLATTIAQLQRAATTLDELADLLEAKAQAYQRQVDTLLSYTPTHWQQSWFKTAIARYDRQAKTAIGKVEDEYAYYQYFKDTDWYNPKVWVPIQVGDITTFIQARPGFCGSCTLSGSERGAHLNQIGSWEQERANLLTDLAAEVRAQSAGTGEATAPDFMTAETLALASYYASRLEATEALETTSLNEQAATQREVTRLNTTGDAYSNMESEANAATDPYITFWHATARDAAGRL